MLGTRFTRFPRPKKMQFPKRSAEQHGKWPSKPSRTGQFTHKEHHNPSTRPSNFFFFQKMLCYKCWNLNMIMVTCWNSIQLQDQFTPIFRLWHLTHGCDVVCPIVVAVVSWQRRPTDLCAHTWHRLGTHILCWQVHLEDFLLHLSWIVALSARHFQSCLTLLRVPSPPSPTQKLHPLIPTGTI